MLQAFRDLAHLAAYGRISLRDAAYLLAVERVRRAEEKRGVLTYSRAWRGAVFRA